MPIGFLDPRISQRTAALDAPSNPLKGAPPPEVPLTEPPLVRVIAQVRFPLIASVEKQEFIAGFQEAIRGDYPVLRPQQSRVLSFGNEGVRDARKLSSWRFQDVEERWRLTLAPDFLALETTDYRSRNDFLERWEKALVALEDQVKPGVLDRVGVRYIDRFVVEDHSEISTLMRSEVAGLVGTDLAEAVVHAISENLFELPEEGGRLLARWGLVPPGHTVDPATIEAIQEASWLLDLDAFRMETQAMDVGAVVGQCRAFAERIYSLFRWAVSDAFLTRYGGRP